jgi:hypothetical protein
MVLCVFLVELSAGIVAFVYRGEVCSMINNFFVEKTSHQGSVHAGCAGRRLDSAAQHSHPYASFCPALKYNIKN